MLDNTVAIGDLFVRDVDQFPHAIKIILVLGMTDTHVTYVCIIQMYGKESITIMKNTTTWWVHNVDTYHVSAMQE